MAPPRILIVDDDLDTLESLEAVIEWLFDVEVRSTPVPDEALRIVREWAPHVALVDYKLGTTDGVTLVQAFHGVRPHLVCVMVTAHPGVPVARPPPGIAQVVPKPTSADALAGVLGPLLDQVKAKAAKDGVRKPQECSGAP